MPLTIKIPGKPGSVWNVGTGAPIASANAGDLYLRTDTGDVYQSSGGTSWALVENISGPAGPSALGAGAVLSFGADTPATDLYRAAASALQTDASFTAYTNQASKYAGVFVNTNANGYGLSVSTGGDSPALTATQIGDAYNRFIMSTNGVMQWGSGSGTSDTNFYRVAGGTLKTDGAIYAATGLTGAGTGLVSLPQSGAYGLQISRSGESQPRLVVSEFGSLLLGSGSAAPDTNLYRNGVALMRTDGALQVGGTLTATGAIAGATNVVPAGGASGQVLAKSSATDYATGWTTPAASGAMIVVTAGASQTLSNMTSVFATAPSSATTLTLPIGVANGRVDITRADASGNTVTVVPPSGGLLYINGGTAGSYAVNYPGQQVTFAYSGTDGGWRLLEANTSAANGGLNPVQITASLNAVPGTMYLANPASAATVTLPAISTISGGSQIGVKNITTAGAVTVTGTIDGVSTSTVLPPGYMSMFVADLASSTWRLITDRPAGIDNGPGYVSTYWYDCRTSTIATVASGGLAAGVYYTPFYSPRRVQISNLLINCTTAGTTSSVRLGVFACDMSTFRPSTVIYDPGVTIATTAAGQKTQPASGVFLPAGYCFLAIGVVGNPSASTVPIGGMPSLMGTASATWSATNYGGYTSTAASTFAANPTVNGFSQAPVNVWFQVA